MILVNDPNNREEEKRAREKEIQMYRIFSAQIELIGSLLNADQMKDILFDPLVDDLFLIVSYNKTDPLLLTAVCYLIHKSLECIDQFRNSKRKSDKTNFNPADEMKNRVEKMQHGQNLIEYLGVMSPEKDLVIGDGNDGAAALQGQGKNGQSID